MVTNFAAGTLVVLGVLFSVLGLFAGGRLDFVIVGLAAVAAGGILGLIGRRVAP